MTIINPDGSETEISDDSRTARAYRALAIAAESMGRNGYRSYVASKRPKLPFRPSQAHTEIMEAMPLLLAGTITPEEAMSLLHGYDVMKERF